jgi:four helix bundle protein
MREETMQDFTNLAAMSICSNIAEGCGRRGDREFRRFLDVPMCSACELECETMLSVDLVFISGRGREPREGAPSGSGCGTGS